MDSASCCRRKRRRRQDRFIAVAVVVALTYVVVTTAASSSASSLGHDDSHRSDVFHKNRKLLQQEATDLTSLPNNPIVKGNSSDDQLFPREIFTDQQLRHGAVVLYILGVVYMFYALALVCDEFFVPSLDVIGDKLGISPDVAGATFMAAGGSAPELFTSIIGVFITKNDVGIGTIVGSAVFNILFVIAACAFAAKEALSLTAWPLIRDVFFYSVSLALLVLFFLDNQIVWWEALILFLWYFSYVGFMKFNEAAENSLRKLFRLPERNRESIVRGVTIRDAHNRKGLFHLMKETISPGILRGRPHDQGDEMHPLKTRKEIMIGESASGIGQLKTQLKPIGSAATDVSTAGNGSTITRETDDVTPTQVLGGGDQHNNEPQWASSASAVVAAAAEEETNVEEEQVEEEPIDMTFPNGGGWKQILVYIVSFPIMAPLFVTLPDTKNPRRRRFFVLTFLGSILWIAVFSYLMVWWATVVGNVVGIPPPIMGLTFLAAGTSVPDLITSVLVAKRGKGDMAVSSSVGSNIFDVTVGLPVPWLLYAAISQKPVAVSSDGLGCSVSLLFLMLILVFLFIVAFRWKMTKGMGIVMMFLYAVFVVVALGFTYRWYSCPI